MRKRKKKETEDECNWSHVIFVKKTNLNGFIIKNFVHLVVWWKEILKGILLKVFL